ncbi:MAG: pyrroloquinoline quinone-dependent dehydrogenase [Rhodothermales bacterium]
MRISLAFAACALVVAACKPVPQAPPGPPAPADWPAYGADAGGSRYAPLDQINRENVSQLTVAWTAKNGDLPHNPTTAPDRQGPCGKCHASESKFEATPIQVANRLYISTPLNRAVALDASTGETIWSYDPKLDLDQERSEGFVSRGVSFWEDVDAPADAVCRKRIYLPTVDARLIALDADSGSLCRNFGWRGTVDLTDEIDHLQVGQYGVTSPPVVVNGMVIVGTSIGDNRRVEMEQGIVRAYDARSGDLKWTWDPIPRQAGMPGWNTWTPEGAKKTGGANAWPPLSADPERNLVFVPTGSAAPDYYGGERPGDNLFANSVVALDASTGEYRWHFQVVHHDLWDYDIPAQPSLFMMKRDGQSIPATVAATKMGFLYFLNRDTGEPLFPVEERPVPASDVPGEVASPTQPFPTRPAPLHPIDIAPEDAWGINDADRAFCRAQMETFRYEGAFTPPSIGGTLIYPGYAGGVNWGGVAVDSDSQTLVTTIISIPFWVRLSEREAGSKEGNQIGTPYHMSRAAFMSPSGLPCTPPPWGRLVAIDLPTGDVKWDLPLGVMKGLEDVPDAASWGSLAMGGPIITAGGLVFAAAAMDDTLRAFDVETGELLWQADLPAGGQATPMTYEVDGRQYVVIAAGGHANLGTTLGDFVVAFALP